MATGLIVLAGGKPLIVHVLEKARMLPEIERAS